MVHRVGVVPVGQASVAVAVSAAHREEAFAACRYGIDTLKATVPIWKKEYYEGGEHWVGPCHVHAAHSDEGEMKIRKAVHAGYCWGVERALDIVTDTAAAHPGETVRTLGPIIHNPHVVQSLEEKGVQSVNGPRRARERRYGDHPDPRRSARNLRAGEGAGVERRRRDLSSGDPRAEQGEAARAGGVPPRHLRQPEAPRGDRHDRPCRRQGDGHRASRGRREDVVPEAGRASSCRRPRRSSSWRRSSPSSRRAARSSRSSTRSATPPSSAKRRPASSRARSRW